MFVANQGHLGTCLKLAGGLGGGWGGWMVTVFLDLQKGGLRGRGAGVAQW